MDEFGSATMGLLKSAVDAFQNDDREKAERISRILLSYPQLGDLPKAGAHLLLAYGADHPVEHAEQALDLYENLFVVRPGGSFTGENPPTEYALRRQEAQIREARRALDAAKTQEREIDADFDKQMALWLQHHDGVRPTDAQLAEADLDLKTEWFEHFDAVDAVLAQDPPDPTLTGGAADYDSEDDAGDAPLVIHRSTGPAPRLPPRVDAAMATPIPSIPLNPQIPLVNPGLLPHLPPPAPSSSTDNPFSVGYGFPFGIATPAAISSPRKDDNAGEGPSHRP